MILQQPMAPAEVPLAKATIPNDALRAFPTVLVRASDPLRGHAAAQGQREMQRCFAANAVLAERPAGGGEVLAAIHETKVGLGEGSAEGEDGGQVLDGKVGRYCYGESCGCVVSPAFLSGLNPRRRR